jgi:hypothetical protein
MTPEIGHELGGVCLHDHDISIAATKTTDSLMLITGKITSALNIDGLGLILP